MSLKAMLALLATITTTCLVFTSLVASTPSQRCLDCICHASSGCKANLRCHNTGAGQYFCGPYQISWAYWADGGKPGNRGYANDFENCLVDKPCAEQAIRGYMAKWGSDCNKDGRIDCLDYAAIHQAGPNGCQQTWLLNSKYWTQFNQCYGKGGTEASANRAFASSGLYSPRANPRSDLGITSVRTISSPSSNIIEIPAPSVRTTNLIVSPSGDLSPSSGPNIGGFSSSSSSSESINYPSPGVIVHTSSSSYRSSSSSSSRLNYSSSEFEEISGGDGGVSPKVDEGVADAAYIRPARVQNTPSSAPSPIVSISAAPVTSYQPSRPSARSPVVSITAAPVTSYQPSRPSTPGRVVSVIEEVTTRHESQPRRPSHITTATAYSSGPTGASAISHSGPRVARPAGGSGVSNALPVSSTTTTTTSSVVPSDCMQCLCHASSKCNLSKGCDGAYCGAFLLSWGYWADGGSPGASQGLDYPSCARDRGCAEQAVHGYMGKWQRDCNGDGRVDCIDFALIHKLGPHACGRLPALESSDYWRQFMECRQSTSSNVADNLPEVETIEEPRSNPRERSVVSSSSVNTLVDHSQPINSPNTLQPNNINANIISRTPYINRPAAIVTAGRQPQPAPQPRPARLNDIYENARGNSFPTVNSVPDQLAPQPPPQPPSPVVVEEVNNEPIPPKPQPPTAGLTEVVVTPAPRPASRARPVSSTNTTTSTSGVTKECLECICHASSRCSNSIGCVSNGRGKHNCGPYQVDWEYWAEAGKPGTRPDLSTGENFQMCLNNRECADQTVRAFLARFQRDCNDDGVIDCNDFAAVHVAGPKACNAQWYTESKYYSDFRECYDF